MWTTESPYKKVFNWWAITPKVLDKIRHKGNLLPWKKLNICVHVTYFVWEIAWYSFVHLRIVYFATHQPAQGGGVKLLPSPRPYNTTSAHRG